MKFFRESEDFMGKKIISRLDYLEQDELPKSNIMEFVFEDESKVIVRPSGTEPKIKIYLFSHGDDAKKAQQIIEENEARMRQIMQAE
jgi:phosphomannomutase